jgi:lauroyl/myristoyl acyltransferase
MSLPSSLVITDVKAAEEGFLVPSEAARTPLLRGRGYRIGFIFFLLGLFFRSIHLADRLFGPRGIAACVFGFYLAELWQRRRDYAYFARLRDALPTEVRRNVTHRQAWHNLIWHWELTGGAILSYHRLGLPSWQKRFHVTGTAPWDRPEWGQRPVILTYLHTCAFPLLPFWLRSRGIPTGLMAFGLPLILNNHVFAAIRTAGDHRYGIDGVPLTFERRGPAVRNAIRFVAPGRILVIAVDGGKVDEQHDAYDAGGFPFYAKQGASRIAAQTGALLIPVTIRCTNEVEFHVHFGKPVPDELLQKRDFAASTQHLVSELWGAIREHPGELAWTALESISPGAKADRTAWM